VRRGEDVETGIRRLCAELQRLAATTPDLDQLCDRLLGRMVPTRREDDIALVAVTLHPQDQRRADQHEPGLDDTGARSHTVQARFAADPASVPAVRRFVRDAVVGSAPALAYDAELCVSELAANAALHSGSGFMEVAVRLDPTAVTISVTDEGDTPAEAVVPRLVVSDGAARLDAEATTGRGLGIVSVLAEEWGVEVTPTGKRVWATLGEDAEEGEVRLPDSSPSSALPAQGDVDLPPGWSRVVLRDCPTRLSIRQDEHLDELVRELQLLAIDRDNVRSRRLAAELQELLGGPAHARHLGRRTALDAAAAGLEVVDVEMVLPQEVAGATRRLEAVVRSADRLCEEEELLTIASPPEVRQLRAWMTDEVEAQLRDGAEPVGWADWRRRNGLPDLPA
jgi:anti-sigma regulatory factor (Ser/Thr protein kinase)